MNTDELERTREVCAAGLLDPELREIADILGRTGGDAHQIPAIVSTVSDHRPTHDEFRSLQSDVSGAGIDPGRRAFERFLILTTALDTLGRVSSAPVSRDVKSLICQEFRFYAEPPGEHAARFTLGSASFVSMCKTASLRRFPGGQFDWEVSGIGRRDIAAVSLRSLVQTIAFALLKMRGLRPVFFSHLNWRRTSKSLNEIEANRSYYRMARAMELQPAIKGFAACSWFRSPATHRVSPHLAWVSRVILDNGGFVVEAGAAAPDSGVLHRSETRKRLYEAGQFQPTKGLVMWPRAAMIAWARAHVE